MSTVVAAPIAVALSAVAAGACLLCMASRLVARKLEAKILKHDRIAVLARSKKNSIDVIVSKAIADNDISDSECKLVVEEMAKCQELKGVIRSKIRSQILADEDVTKLVMEGRADERRNHLARLGT